MSASSRKASLGSDISLPIKFHSQRLKSPLDPLIIIIFNLHQRLQRFPKPNLQQYTTKTIDIMRSGVSYCGIPTFVGMLVVIESLFKLFRMSVAWSSRISGAVCICF